jgi:2-methylene-furan-3-one reductase
MRITLATSLFALLTDTKNGNQSVNMAAVEIPASMKACLGKDYGDIDEMLSVKDGVKVPRLADVPEKKRKEWMVIRTLAVSVAPGDVRVLSGKTRELQGPPSMPYVPCGDCCGIVVEIEDPDLPFQVGDRVAARFVDRPRGALGEYALVSVRVADKVPDNLTSEQAAAMIGASPATVLAQRVKDGERVLVFGAGGGMGSTLCQMLRIRGASYVAGVSRSPDRLLKDPLNLDDAIDYTTTDIFTLEKYQKDKFDVIVDLAGHGYARLQQCVRAGEPLIVKTNSHGGRFLTTVPPVGPWFELHTWFAVIKAFLIDCLVLAISSRTWNRSKLPAYTFAMSLSEEREPATVALTYASSGKLKPVIDPKGQFPFTTKGIREAFRLQESQHPFGKVVVRVAEA